jgi:hypothetical protein
MNRTPMEMSAYRMAKRHENCIGVDVFIAQVVFGRRGFGSIMRKARRRIKAELREARVLQRRIARKGSTVYE